MHHKIVLQHNKLKIQIPAHNKAYYNIVKVVLVRIIIIKQQNVNKYTKQYKYT